MRLSFQNTARGKAGPPGGREIKTKDHFRLGGKAVWDLERKVS
jgi:hypothetical protein